MQPWSAHIFLQKAAASGWDDGDALAAVEQANGLTSAGLPPLMCLAELADACQVPTTFLRGIIAGNSAYRSFSIRKRSGGRRPIFVPATPLMTVQKLLAREILRKLPPHPASFAFARDNSIVACASRHCGARWLLKWDLRAFFSSVSENQVFAIFSEVGYSPQFAFQLARICTTSMAADPDLIRLIAQLRELPADTGFLPQGAPTSPMLSNLAAYDLDERLTRFAKKNKLVYTRYADDITMSPLQRDFRRRRVQITKNAVDNIIRSRGFLANDDKFSVSPPGARKLVLGLLVDQDVPRLNKKFRKRLDQHVYHLRRRGPYLHSQHLGFRSLFVLRLHIEGLISFARLVEPSYGLSKLDEMRGVDWPF